MIEQVKNKYVGITLDGWKADNCKEYISVSGSYFDDLFHLQTLTLAVSQVNNEKSNTIIEVIELVKEKYMLKIASVTCDNAANMISAVKHYNNDVLRCMNHSLQLAIEKSMDKDSPISKCIYRFNTLAKELRTVSNRQKLNLKFCIMSTTRWNSTFLMLEKIELHKKELQEYYKTEYEKYVTSMEKYEESKKIGIINMQKPKKNSLLDVIPSPTSADYIMLRHLVVILKPMYNLTIKLSNRNITAGMAYLHYKQVIFEKTEIADEDRPPLLEKFEEKLKKNMDERLMLINKDSKIPLLCCMLDIRVKAFIERRCVGFTDDEYMESKNALISIFNTNIGNDYTYVPILSTTLDKYLAEGEKRRRINNSDELEIYLNYNERYSTSEDISTIWLSLRSTFPQIFELCKRYLCAQITSCEVERIFSLAGAISNDRKSNISSEHLEQKILISRNRSI